MVSLTDVQIGSVVLTMVENVPVAISGIMVTLVDQEIWNAENYTGDSIGTTVAEKYQPAIISLTASSVVRMMELTGADVSSIKLGDMTVNKGSTSSTAWTSSALKEDGMNKLKNLGAEFNYFKANG